MSTKQYQVAKQGVELEIHTLNLGDPTKNTSIDVGKLANTVNGGYHHDDSKIEFSSLPFENLGDLEDHLIKCVGDGLHFISKFGHPILMGCLPYYQDFASGHIHTSTEKMNANTWLELRRKLYNAQPLIALLGQNSPICNSTKFADVRLAVSSWSHFTSFDDFSRSHSMSLAMGNGANTLEVRIPSACVLPQILGIAALIRVLLQEDTEVIAQPLTSENFENVVHFGSSSISKVCLPESLSYSGIKTKTLNIKTTDLWKVYLEENIEVFKKVIEGVSSKTRSNILEFYEFISSGKSMSDAYYELFDLDMKNKHSFPEIASILSYETYYSRSSPWNYLKFNCPSFLPTIEGFYSLEELKEIFENIRKKNIRMNAYKLDAYSALEGEIGIWSNVSTRKLLRDLTINGKLNKDRREVCTNNMVHFLLKTEVLAEKDECIVPGKNFSMVLQIGRNGGYL